VLSAGSETVCDENDRLNDVEGDAYEKAISMETAAVDDEVATGDGQQEEATEDTTSPAPEQTAAYSHSPEPGNISTSQCRHLTTF